MHIESLNEMRRILDLFMGVEFAKDVTVLEVGSYRVQQDIGTYKDLLPACWRYTGTDIAAGENVDVVQDDPYELPFLDGNFDLVISGQTLEHVPFFWKLLAEMGRVLKESGLLILAVPSAWPEHKYPVDCWRWLPDGMQVALEVAGVSHGESQVWIDNNICWGLGRKPSAE